MPRHKVSIENSRQIERVADRLSPLDVTSLSFNEQLTIVLNHLEVDMYQQANSPETTGNAADSGAASDVDMTSVEEWTTKDSPYDR